MANKDIRVKHAYSMIEKYGVANALYLPENRSQRSVSKEGNSWLDQLGIPSHFREKIVTGTNFQVDALDEENKIVYEYLGSFWHGNPEKFNSQDIHPITKRTFGSMYQETQERLAIIESLGYQIVSKWS